LPSKFNLTKSTTLVLEQYSAANPGKLLSSSASGVKNWRLALAGRAVHHHRIVGGRLSFTPDMTREEADGWCSASTTSQKNIKGQFEMIFPPSDGRSICPDIAVVGLRQSVCAGAVFNFRRPNHYLYERGSELKFFAPTAPDKPWTSGSFGCVRNDGQRLHEGLDILHLQPTGVANRPIRSWLPPTARSFIST